MYCLFFLLRDNLFRFQPLFVFVLAFFKRETECTNYMRCCLDFQKLSPPLVIQTTNDKLVLSTLQIII